MRSLLDSAVCFVRRCALMVGGIRVLAVMRTVLESFASPVLSWAVATTSYGLNPRPGLVSSRTLVLIYGMVGP